MINIRFELVLNFKEETRNRTPARAVFEILGGRISKEKRPKEPSAIIRDENKHFAVRWSYDSCGILYEDYDNYRKCADNCSELLEKINNVAPIGTISQRILRTYWILPAKKYDFKSLEAVYRKTFIRENPLYIDCIDSSVVFVLKRGGFNLQFQSGAMGINQLQKDYMLFRIKKGYPKTFIFLSCIVIKEEDIVYSDGIIKEFYNTAFTVSEEHANIFEGIMKEVL